MELTYKPIFSTTLIYLLLYHNISILNIFFYFSVEYRVTANSPKGC